MLVGLLYMFTVDHFAPLIDWSLGNIFWQLGLVPTMSEPIVSPKDVAMSVAVIISILILSPAFPLGAILLLLSSHSGKLREAKSRRRKAQRKRRWRRWLAR